MPLKSPGTSDANGLQREVTPRSRRREDRDLEPSFPLFFAEQRGIHVPEQLSREPLDPSNSLAQKAAIDDHPPHEAGASFTEERDTAGMAAARIPRTR